MACRRRALLDSRPSQRWWRLQVLVSPDKSSSIPACLRGVTIARDARFNDTITTCPLGWADGRDELVTNALLLLRPATPDSPTPVGLSLVGKERREEKEFIFKKKNRLILFISMDEDVDHESDPKQRKNYQK